MQKKKKKNVIMENILSQKVILIYFIYLKDTK